MSLDLDRHVAVADDDCSRDDGGGVRTEFIYCVHRPLVKEQNTSRSRGFDSNSDFGSTSHL